MLKIWNHKDSQYYSDVAVLKHIGAYDGAVITDGNRIAVVKDTNGGDVYLEGISDCSIKVSPLCIRPWRLVEFEQ